MKVTSKAMAIVLSLLCLGFCGCGAENAPVPSPEVTEEPQLESYYAADINVLSEGETYLSARACTDEGFYSVDYSTQYTEDGSEIYGPGISFVSYNGEKTALEAYHPVQPPQELAAQPNFSSSLELEGLALDHDGNIVTVESLYMSWYSDPGPRLAEYGAIYDDYESVSYVRVLDKTGKELSCAPLSVNGDSVYAYNLKIDPQGRLVLSQQRSLLFYSVEGEEIGRIELDGYIRTLLQDESGELYAVCYAENGGELFCHVSTENMKLEESFPIPGGLMYICPGDSEYDLYYSDGFDFYGYSSKLAKAEHIFNWLACGVDVNTLSSVQVSENGAVRAIGGTFDSQGKFICELVDIYRHESIKAPTELSLGCYSLDNRLTSVIKSFNRRDSQYRVVPQEYYKNYDFTIADQLQLLEARLMERQMPDILVLDGMNHRLFASKGLFADLYPFLDADGGPERQDFFPNVLKSCERSGSLYALADAFSVETVLADAAIAGTDPGWSYQQYDAALAQMGDNCDAFENHITSQDLMKSLLAMEMDSYIDWETLSADFENDSFRGILEFTSAFPYSFDWDNYQWSDADIVEYRISGGRQMLLRSPFVNIEEIFYNSIYFNGNVAYKGYPTHDGSVGNTIVPYRLCAISEGSQHKDGAWAFISGLLESEEDGSAWGIPSLIPRYERLAEKLSQPYYLENEDHEPVLSEDNQTIELPQGHMGTVLGVRSYYSLTPELKAQLEMLLTSSEKLIFEQYRFIELVTDSVSPYYQGRLNADEAIAAAEYAVEAELSKYK